MNRIGPEQTPELARQLDLNVFVIWNATDDEMYETFLHVKDLLESHGCRLADEFIITQEAEDEGKIEEQNARCSQALGEANCVIALIPPLARDGSDRILHPLDSEMRYVQYWTHEKPVAYYPILVGVNSQFPGYSRRSAAAVTEVSPNITFVDQQNIIKSLRGIREKLKAIGAAPFIPRE